MNKLCDVYWWYLNKMGKLHRGQFPALISALVLQDVTIGENWVQGTQNLYVLFLTTTCESMFMTKQKF